MITMRLGHGVTWEDLIAGGMRGGVAIAIAFAIWRIARRVPWPRPFRFRFVLTYVVAWFAVSFTWCIATNALIAIAGIATFDSLPSRRAVRLCECFYITLFVGDG
jgi:hypothetical protein